MEEQLISLKTAKLAKKKKFNIPVINYVNINGDTSPCIELTTYYRNGDGIDKLGGEKLLDYNNLKNTYLDEYESWAKHWDKDDKFIFYSAPTQSLLLKWLREVHRIYINIEYVDSILYFSTITDMKTNTIIYENSHSNISYEEVLEKDLYEALKMI